VNSPRDTLEYLYGLEYRGMKFGLRNIRALLASAGHPENAFPSIHVAGTNGKGSTSAFLASIFREAGCRTGLYTSPHLIRFTERIRVNGKEIPDERLAYYVAALRPAIEKTGATFFEATTCVAFLYFVDEGVDIAVVETGLGGRLDATNVLRPLVSVITNVSFDHREFLGNTLRAIAREKAGIIKQGVPVVTASIDPVVLSVLRQAASRRGTRLSLSYELVRTSKRKSDGRVSFRSRGLSIAPVRPGLAGEFQRHNAALAVAALVVLLRNRSARKELPGLNARTIRRGIARVRMNTGLQGRLQKIRSGGGVLIDVAHNHEGIRTLIRELGTLKPPPRVAVFGVMKDKEYGAMLGELSAFVGTLVAVRPATRRALPIGVLMREARKNGMKVVRGGSVASGLRRARGIAGNRPILVTGSHYVAGEALATLYGEKA
jgi:dihydrofolate synthase/folylpolyglutamate synthase